jgi:CRISPR/Cas system-associated exonuclease Cas4 (RecB family)
MPKTRGRNPDVFHVSASTVGRYVICPRATWIELNGKTADPMGRLARGRQAHKVFERGFSRNLKKRSFGRFGSVCLILAILGVVLYFRYHTFLEALMRR